MKQKTYTVYYKEKSKKHCGSLIKKHQEFITDDYSSLVYALKYIRVWDISDVEDIDILTNGTMWTKCSVLALYNHKERRVYRKSGKMVGSKSSKTKRKKKWNGHPNKYIGEINPLVNRKNNRMKKSGQYPEYKYCY